MSPFDWMGKPSATGESLKPSPKARTNKNPTPIKGLSRKADELMRVRFGGAFSRAVPKETKDVL